MNRIASLLLIAALLWSGALLRGHEYRQQPPDGPSIQQLQPRFKLKGHTGSLGSLAFSPDGKLLATGGFEDHLIKLWDSQAGNLRTILKGHLDMVEGMAFTSDGKTLISLAADGTARLWDMPFGRMRKTLQTGLAEGIPVFLALSPDSHILATGGFDEVVRLWNLPSGKLRATFTVPQTGITSLVFSSDCKWLASSGGDGLVRIWNVATGRLFRALRGDPRGLRQVCFSPDGSLLASIDGVQDAVRLWDRQTGTLQKTVKGQTSGIIQIAFTKDGKTLVGCAVGSLVVLWDVASGQIKRSLPWAADAFGLSPDGKLLVANSAGGPNGQQAQVWDLNTGKELAILPGAAVEILSFSPDSRTLATSYRDATTVALWTLPSP